MESPNSNNPAELQKPGGSAPAAPEPVIHVIPEKFYGAALRKKVVKEPPKPPVSPPVAPPGPPQPQKKSKVGLLIAVILFVLLAGGGGAAYFLFFAKKPATNTNQNVNVAPPAPVCGDAKCESPETANNCTADCGPPPAVCGDAKCESPQESSANCTADCGPPPAVCGDAKCDTDETVDSCPADCTPPEPVAGLDSDSDGLSDLEESEIYGTSSQDANTDKDSFVDLNEVLNLFDPATPAPSLLRDNPGITVYVNDQEKYSIYRSAQWTMKEDAAKKEVFFTSSSGEFIEVLVQDKPPEQSLMDWYLAQAPGVKSSDVQFFKTKQDYDQILSPDRMTAFVAVGGHVYVISYNLGSHTVINYKVTHQMMVNSLIVK